MENRDTAVLSSLGLDKVIKDAGSYSANSDFYGSNRTVQQPKTNVLANIGQSISKLPGAVGGFLADQFVNPAKTFFTGSLSALKADQFRQTQDAQRQTLDTKLKSLSKQYSNHTISKADYQAGIKSVQDEYSKISSANQQYGEQLGNPLDVVKAGAETLALPFAFGKLARAGEVLSGLEQAASKIPGIGRALEAAPKAESAVKTLAKGVVKYPLVTRPSVDIPIQTAQDVAQGNYGSAALNAGLLATTAVGGPISLAKKLGGALGKGVNRAIIGQESLFKGIKTKDGTLLGFVQDLEKKAAAGSKQAAKDLETARIYQQYKLDETGGNVSSAIKELQLHYKNRPTEGLSGREVFNDFKKFFENTQKVKAADEAGLIPRTEGQQYLSARVGRFSTAEANDLKTQLQGITDPAERRAVAYKWLETSDAGKNPILREDIMAAAENGNLSTKRLTTLNPKATVPGLDRGYFPILSKGARAEFKPVGQTAKSFTETKPLVPGIRNLLRKAGISPEGQDASVYKRIEDAATEKINNIGISSIKTRTGDLATGENVGRAVTSRLLELLDIKKGAHDVRQLRVSEIGTALGITREQAAQVADAIHNAHFAVSLGERGLAQRIQDLNLKFNPLARAYSRIQGAAKYELNPFFQAQTTIETELLGQGLTGGNMAGLKRLFGKQDANVIVRNLEDAGFFRGERGAGAAQGGPFVSAKLSLIQKRQLAGTIQVLAENRGITIPQLLRDPEMRDQIRAIVQYPEKGIFSSNLGKTANMVFFPITYNFKVAKLLGDALAKLPAITQVATVKGAVDFNDWLNTDDGIKWQSKNSEALGILKYFTPENSIESVWKILTGKAQTSDFGMIGGLPFGFISQILQDHGLIPRTDAPYLNPKTGEVVPDKIPKDLAASASTALRDLINSMYNFPGRTVGLGSKNDITNALTGGLTNQGQTESVTRTDLTDRQKKQQAILGPMNAPKAGTPTPTKLKFNAPQGRIPIVPGPTKRKRAKVYARPMPS